MDQEERFQRLEEAVFGEAKPEPARSRAIGSIRLRQIDGDRYVVELSDSVDTSQIGFDWTEIYV